jgi:hypothetical protein
VKFKECAVEDLDVKQATLIGRDIDVSTKEEFLQFRPMRYRRGKSVAASD